jgi:hypothetical protein
LFLLLISQAKILGIDFLHENFANLMLFSVIGQNLLLGIVFAITQNAKSYYFVDIEKNILKHKLLFLLTILINLIFIGMPFSPSFSIKDMIFRNVNPVWEQILYSIVLMNITAHLFILPFRIFRNKIINFRSNSFSWTEYLKNLSIVVICLCYLIFIYRKSVIPFEIFHKYLQFIVASGLMFFLFQKLISRVSTISLDVDVVFYYIKSFLKSCVEVFIESTVFFSKNLNILYLRVSVWNSSSIIVSCNAILLTIFVYLLCIFWNFIEF